MCFNIVPKCSECRARPCSATICGGSLPLAARVMTSRVCRYRRGVPIMGTQWKTQSCVAKVVQVHASSKSSKSKPRISATPLPSVVLPASGRRNVPSANTQPQPPPPLWTPRQPEPPRRRGTIENAHPSVSTHPDKGHLKMFAAMSRHVQTTSYHVISCHIYFYGWRKSFPTTAGYGHGELCSYAFNIFQLSTKLQLVGRTWWQARPSCTSMCFRASESKYARDCKSKRTNRTNWTNWCKVKSILSCAAEMTNPNASLESLMRYSVAGGGVLALLSHHNANSWQMYLMVLAKTCCCLSFGPALLSQEVAHHVRDCSKFSIII